MKKTLLLVFVGWLILIALIFFLRSTAPQAMKPVIDTTGYATATVPTREPEAAPGLETDPDCPSDKIFFEHQCISPGQEKYFSYDWDIPKNGHTTPMQVNWLLRLKPASLDVLQGGYYAGSENDKTFEAGTVVGGSYDGGTVIVAEVVPDGMAFGDDFFIFVRRTDGSVTLLGRESQSFEGYAKDYKTPDFVLDTSTVIPDLHTPDRVQSGNIVLVHTGDSAFFARPTGLFDATGKTAAMFIPGVGQLYRDAQEGDRRARNGLYVRLPDGMEDVYSIEIPWFGKDRIPAVTWNDGSKNATEYNDTDRTGCGSYNLVSVVSIPQSQLVSTGVTATGETVFEYADTHEPRLQALYDGIWQNKPTYEAFAAGHPMFFWKDSLGRLIKFERADFIPPTECAKPVIYLYPPATSTVSVKLFPQGGFTKTEPAYHDGWNVMATPQGSITEQATGVTYPYLFWEGRGGLYTRPDRGFVVSRDGVHGLLEDSLSKLGLNSRERADFEEFWEPRMKAAPYYFVTFLGTRAMDTIAPLDIEPRPDTVIRVLMDFEPLQKPRPVVPIELTARPRTGFTVIEWGGVTQ